MYSTFKKMVIAILIMMFLLLFIACGDVIQNTEDVNTQDVNAQDTGVSNSLNIGESYSSGDITLSNIQLSQTDERIMITYKLEDNTKSILSEVDYNKVEFLRASGDFELYNKANEKIGSIRITGTLSQLITSKTETVFGKIREGFEDIVVDRVEVDLSVR
jgi:hypothetical protein